MMDDIIKSSNNKTHNRARGNHYESLAACYLEKQGLKKVTQNYRCRLGEIDLIFKDKADLVFVEVKYRRNLDYGSPLESISVKKISTIRKVAEHFISTHPRISAYPKISALPRLTLNPRFDVMGIVFDPSNLSQMPEPQISWIKHAF